MNLLNLANCSTQGNTGGTFCNIEPVYIVYAFFVPVGTVIPATALASQAAFTTYVQTTSLWANSRSSRWQRSPKLGDFKDNTKEPNLEDIDGYMATTQFLPYDWTYRCITGQSGTSKNLWQTWRAYINGQQDLFNVYFVDANNQWLGTSALDSTGAQGLGSISLTNILIYDWGQATTKTANKYMMRLMLADNTQLNQYFAGFTCTTNTANYKPLTDVAIVAGTTAISATHIYVSGTIGGNTLGKQFGTTLAAVSAWVITDTTTGTKTFTASGVTYDTVNDQYNIAGTWSTSNTGDTVTVALATPSVMTVTPFFTAIVTEGTNIYSYVAP